ncbi:MAG: outer membrane lipoprotein carrier protein LolA [Bacteriovoracaceae bacterium]
MVSLCKSQGSLKPFLSSLISFLIILNSGFCVETKAKAKIKTEAKIESDFLPKTFKSDFEQRFISSISGKEKVSSGLIEYQYPSHIRFEVLSPDKTIFVSNPKMSWYYTAPFIETEKGQVTLKASNKLLLTQFFDLLSKGLTNNSFYTVRKEKEFYELSFKDKITKEMNIKRAYLYYSGSALTNLVQVKKVKLFYPDDRVVDLIFSNLQTNVTISDDRFVFEIPPNTVISE